MALFRVACCIVRNREPRTLSETKFQAYELQALRVSLCALLSQLWVCQKSAGYVPVVHCCPLPAGDGFGKKLERG